MIFNLRTQNIIILKMPPSKKIEIYLYLKIKYIDNLYGE